MFRSKIYRLPDDLGPGSAGRRDALPEQDWSPLPQQLPQYCQDYPQEIIPSLCSCLSSTLQGLDISVKSVGKCVWCAGDRVSGGGGAPQHFFQTFRLLHPGV